MIKIVSKTKGNKRIITYYLFSIIPIWKTIYIRCF